MLFLLTNKCNNNCIICQFKGKKRQESFIAKNVIVRKVRENDNVALKTISFGGGEPTLHKDFFKIIADTSCMRPNIEIAILTNGRMFAYNDFTAQFSRLDIKRIKFIIPLHGHKDSIHDNVTQIEGSFLNTVLGIKNLLNIGAILELRVIINKINYQYLNEISYFIFNTFPEFTYLVFISMEINNRAISREAPVPYEQFVPYLEEVLKKYDTTRIKLYHFPLCSINDNHWHLIYKSIDKKKLCFSKECGRCFVKKNCMGILKSYSAYFGNKNFNPITR